MGYGGNGKLELEEVLSTAFASSSFGNGHEHYPTTTDYDRIWMSNL